MDAKVGDWVVTPRRGKAVEINALWYNALRLLRAVAARGAGDAAARRIGAHAERARESFNERFWYAEGGYLYDVVDGEDGDDAVVPAEPDLRDLAAASGARPRRAGQPVVRRGARAAADAGRPALAGAGRSRLQAAATTAIFARATPPITRAPSGPG